MEKPKFPSWHFAGQGILIDDNGDEYPLSVVYDDEPAGRLIAAAPELLEALSEMVTWALKMNRVPRPNSPVARARAAIAKAVSP